MLLLAAPCHRCFASLGVIGGFYREARQAFLEVTGRVDGPAPLDDLLEQLFPSDPSDKTPRCIQS